MNDQPEASVVIGTYNGAKKIPFLLKGLLRQTFLNFEVIVVVDGSTDDTIQVVNNFTSSFKHLKIVPQQNEGRSRVRNRGVREATSNIIIFYDDDMIPYEDSIQRHVAFHKEREGILSGNSIELEDLDKTDIQNYKAFLTTVWTRKYIMGVTQLDFHNLFFTAANSSMRITTFNSLTGFDATLTDAEDHDFAFRALCKRVPVFFDKENMAVHREFLTCVGYIKRLRLYAKAHHKLKKLYPDRYRKFDKKKSIVKRLIYLFFSIPFWPRLVDRELLIKFLPKTIRYKLYDLIIQALANEHPNVKI